MPEIQLSQGFVSIVDDIDFVFLNQWKWCVSLPDKTHYAASRYGTRSMVYMHRIVADRMSLDMSITVDHKNRNGLDNRRQNLRSATSKQQSENMGLRKDNSSGCRGVHWRKEISKWQVRIGHNGKRIHLGYFDKLDEAIFIRSQAEVRYYTHAQ